MLKMAGLGFTRLPRAVLPIYGTTLADTLGYTLMIPLLPVIVRQYHATDLMAGAMLSIPALCSTIAAPVWGTVSDRIGRKPVIIAAQILSLLGYLLLALSHSLALVFLSRIVSGCGGGSLGAVESYVADVTQPEQRAFAYSLYGAVFGVAFIIGPAVSGTLLHDGVALPFFFATGLEAINIIFTALFVPRQTKSTQRRISISESLEAAAMPGVRGVLIRQFLFIFAVVTFMANFSLFVDKTLHVSIAQAAYLLAATGAVGGLVLLAGVTPLARRIGDARTSQLGLLISTAGYVLLIFAHWGWAFTVGLVVWAVGAATAEPSLTTLLTKRADRSKRGAVMGISDAVNSAAMIVGPAIGSAMVGVQAPLVCGLSALASGVALFIHHDSKIGLGLWRNHRQAARR